MLALYWLDIYKKDFCLQKISHWEARKVFPTNSCPLLAETERQLPKVAGFMEGVSAYYIWK